MEFTDFEKRKLVGNDYDLEFLARTQPQGNLKLHSGYIEYGNGYAAFLNVYNFPKNQLPAFWLSSLVNQDKVIAFLSVTDQNAREIRPQLDRSLAELYSRTNDDNMRPTEQMDANIDQQQLYELYDNLKTNSETLKRISLKLMVYDKSVEALLNRVDQIQQDFYAFGMARMIDEQEYELRSIYLPLEKEEQMANHRKGKIIESYDLGGSYMFDYINLVDDGGRYFGYTQTNGAFIFNPYNLKNNQRTRVFSLVGGNAGMGKSTFLQMLNDDAFMRGNLIRNFDVSGEYRQSTKNQSGIILDTSKSGNRVNMFEVFPSVTDNEGNIDEIGSFNQNISKIKAITHIMNKDLTHHDLNLLDDCLVGLYINREMWYPNPSHNLDKINVLNLPHTQYPTVSDFVIYLNNRKDEIQGQLNSSPDDIKSIQNLIYAYKNMASRYSDIFDGHTNIDNFGDERVVTFDMSGTKESTTGGERQLFQAQFFSYLSLISSQLIINGKRQRQLIKNHELVDDKIGYNIDYYYLNIDEAEDYFNPQFPDVVGMLANMMEEMRKNFCAITLAFPTLKDILVTGTGGDVPDADVARYNSSVRKIFGLMQYFHLFNLPNDDTEALKNFFKKNSSVTLEQLDTLQNLSPHQLLSVIVGDRSYRWETELTQKQIERYR